MDKKTFEKFREIVYAKSGISLNDSKVALVTARVGKRMRALGIENHRTYLERVIKDESGEEVVHLLDAISTNVTHFFREANHFSFLESVYREWVKAGQRRFRMWSAACSTGEEPYSMLMTMLSAVDHVNLDLKLLATDISTRVLSASMAGEYTEERIKNVPKNLLHKYFEPRRAGNEKRYVAKGVLKNYVVFRRLNLNEPPFPMRGPLDIIFCRNVMIYFDNVVRKQLLDEMYRLLKPGGYLMVGHAESLTGIVSDFKPVRPSIYVKK